MKSHIKEQIGAKAAQLLKVQASGLRVPEFTVVSFEDFRTLREGFTFEDIPESFLPPDGPEDIRYAVRSSADVEDGIKQSFAGQFLSIMNVPRAKLREAVCEVYHSSVSERVNAYKGETPEIRMSVIIQTCIRADVSGVVFGLDPISGDESVLVINSVYGMGEGLVAGELDADSYRVYEDNRIESSLQDKTHQLIWSMAGGLEKREVEASMIKSSSLTDSQVLELKKSLRRLETLFGFKGDMEFAYENDQLFILQFRPVTVRQSESDYLIWDNSNIIESYPGISMPLTFSFIRPVYSAVYRELCLVLGVRREVLDENGFALDNMLGLLKGRVYYNLYSWYKLLSLLPGYSLNAGFMEKMMGVSERFELKDYRKPSGWRARLDVLRMVFSLIGNMKKLPLMRRDFRKMFGDVLKEQNGRGLENADAVSCMRAYLEFERVLTQNWKAPLVNDFFAMIHYGLFQKFIEKNQSAFDGNQNDYLMMSGSVITVEPARRQSEMAELIRNDKALSLMFESSDEHAIIDWLRQNRTHPFTILFNEYIELWGDRCFAELKLETITYRQDPGRFIRILKQTFMQVQPASLKEKEKELHLHFFKKYVFNRLRKAALRTVTERENLRYERTRAFAHVRKIFCRIGDLFKEQKVIEDSRDIFWLSKDEIFDYIKGTSVQLQLSALIALRKSEYKLYFNEPEQSPRIRTEGIVYANHFGSAKSSDEKVLKGIPCCRGIVRAEVRILKGPENLEGLKGKILVTRSTDPGWVTVFPLVSGILVERGSVLSHAAIVSREMNIPCIVGIKNICETLKDGDIVEMDGLSGELRIIS